MQQKHASTVPPVRSRPAAPTAADSSKGAALGAQTSPQQSPRRQPVPGSPSRTSPAAAGSYSQRYAQFAQPSSSRSPEPNTQQHRKPAASSSPRSPAQPSSSRILEPNTQQHRKPAASSSPRSPASRALHAAVGPKLQQKPQQQQPQRQQAAASPLSPSTHKDASPGKGKQQPAAAAGPPAAVGPPAAAPTVAAAAGDGPHAAAANLAPSASCGSSSSSSSRASLLAQRFSGVAGLSADTSSDSDNSSSSDISSSVSGAAAPDGSALHSVGLECDDANAGHATEPSGSTSASRGCEHQQQQQHGRWRSQSNSSSADTVAGAAAPNTRLNGGLSSRSNGQQLPQELGQQAQQQQHQQEVQAADIQQSGQRLWQQQQQQREAQAAAAAATVTRSISSDPDYELPQGKLTETQVLLTHTEKLYLDRYGFIVSEAEAHARAARVRRTPAQVKREQRHVAKWRRMLGSSREEFMAYAAARPKKVKRRVRKGIPDEFRGLAWQYLSGGRELMQQHPGHYAHLLTSGNGPVDLEIMRDLNRTFPNHVFFHQRQGPGQQSLFHVLRAYSAHDRQVGYVQGMGFVTAILLMYMSEEEAFWTLTALLKGSSQHPPLEGLYQAGMPLLQQCLFQFHELLKEEQPRLGGHLEQEGVVPSMYCTHWFNTIFAYSLPFEQLLRVWDVFLLEGMKVVFRVGVALLLSAQEQLLGMPFERLVEALNSRKLPLLARHPDALLKAALRIPVSRRLEQLQERYQQQVAEAQAAAAAAAAARGSSGAGGIPEDARYPVVPVAMGPSS